jgi:hypothetical protein
MTSRSLAVNAATVSRTCRVPVPRISQSAYFTFEPRGSPGTTHGPCGLRAGDQTCLPRCCTGTCEACRLHDKAPHIIYVAMHNGRTHARALSPSSTARVPTTHTFCTALRPRVRRDAEPRTQLYCCEGRQAPGCSLTHGYLGERLVRHAAWAMDENDTANTRHKLFERDDGR